MAAVRPIRKQSYEQIHLLLKTAILKKICLSARYRGYLRLLCPHLLGRNREDAVHVLAYQYGGSSASGLQAIGSPANWRCISAEKLTDVTFLDDPWLEPPSYNRSQTCITTVEVPVGHFDRAGDKGKEEAPSPS